MKRLISCIAAIFFTANAYGIDLSNYDGMPWANNNEREVFNFSEHTNGVFVVEGYFYSCPYCQDNAKNVNDLAEEYRDETRVTVLDVAHVRDNSSKIRAWIRKHNPNHPVVSDQVGLLGALGISRFPTVKVINCEGDILYTGTGVWNSSKKRAIKSAIETGLDTQCE